MCEKIKTREKKLEKKSKRKHDRKNFPLSTKKARGKNISIACKKKQKKTCEEKTDRKKGKNAPFLKNGLKILHKKKNIVHKKTSCS